MVFVLITEFNLFLSDDWQLPKLTSFLNFFGRPMATGIHRHEVIQKMSGQSFRENTVGMISRSSVINRTTATNSDERELVPTDHLQPLSEPSPIGRGHRSQRQCMSLALGTNKKSLPNLLSR
jgi:hypothetical protein